jgi:hypothetical protein
VVAVFRDASARQPLGHRSRRRRPVLLDVRLEARAIRLAFDNQVVGVVAEAVERALGEDIVVKERKPVRGVSIARDDGRGFAGSLDEELIHVATFFSRHRLENEVVNLC